MRIGWSPQQDAFRLEVSEWLQSHVPRDPRPDEGPEARAFDLAWQRTQYDAGWAGLHWPSTHGGRGLSPIEQLIWHEEAARAGAPDIGVGFVGINHAGPILIEQGTDAQQAAHLQPILRGEAVWCQGFSEPEAGSDLAALRTRGDVDGDDLVVTGQKLWTSYGQYADYQELLVRTDPSAGRHKGLTWIICDMRAAGIEVRPIRQLDGRPELCAIFYDEVRIPLANVVGKLHEGWSVAMSTLALERGAGFIADIRRLAIRVSALAERTCSSGLRRTDLAERLGLLLANVSALQALTYLNLSRAVRRGGLGPEASVLKYQLAMLSQEAGRLSMEAQGAAGLLDGGHGSATRDYLCSYQTSVGAGTSEIQLEIIAERMLGLPRSR